MQTIEPGDTVRHKHRPRLSGGVAFNVLEVEENRALCGFFDIDPDQTYKEEWFDIGDLILVTQITGGFEQQ